jgi:hypothetical protein
VKIYLRTDVDPAKIERNRGLGDNGRVAKFIASEVKRFCDPYVPFRSGLLKNTAMIENGGKQLVYRQPYAHAMYNGVAYGPNYTDGNGNFWSKPGAKKHLTGSSYSYHGAPMRGKQWEKRMMADHSGELTKSVKNYIERR